MHQHKVENERHHCSATVIYSYLAQCCYWLKQDGFLFLFNQITPGEGEIEEMLYG